MIKKPLDFAQRLITSGSFNLPISHIVRLVCAHLGGSYKLVCALFCVLDIDTLAGYVFFQEERQCGTWYYCPSVGLKSEGFAKLGQPSFCGPL